MNAVVAPSSTTQVRPPIGRRVVSFVDGIDDPDGATPLWQRFAQCSLALAFVVGFGVFDDIYIVKVVPYAALQLALVAACFSLAPPGALGAIRLPVPAVLFTTWWLASYFWSSYPDGFVIGNAGDLATVGSIVLLGLVLPFGRVLRTLILFGYFAVVSVYVRWAVSPVAAMRTRDGLTTLHGGFLHKNVMVPCLLVTALATMCFEARRWVRGTVGAVVLVTVILSRSSTGWVCAFCLLVLVVGAESFRRHGGRANRGLGASIALAALGLVVAALAALSDLADLLGKDLTLSGRNRIWDGALDQIAHRPLTGFGGGSWGLVILQDPGRTINLDLGFAVFHSHNGALELLLRFGIVGLVLFCWQLAATARAGVRRLLVPGGFGPFVVGMVVIVVIFAGSEVVTVLGVWFALISLFAVVDREPT